jgi:hypothetical protein
MGHVTVLRMVGRWDTIRFLSWGLFEKKKNVLSINSSGFWFINTENVRDYGGFWYVLGWS